MFWQFTSVDTMKDSKDTSNPSIQLSLAGIAEDALLCAGLNTTHVTVDVMYDYPDYMAKWVNAIRAAGKNVWFRCHWNHWEGDNGAPADMTPSGYLTATNAFIAANPTLFQPGDIFDPCPEPNNSPYWVATYGAGYNNTAPNAASNAFNQFLVDLCNQSQAALNAMDITGVITGIISLSGFYSDNLFVLYQSTVDALGYLTIDDYPEGSSTSPSVCAAAWLTNLQSAQAARPNTPIVIGEMGYSNVVNVDDATQNAVLAAELAAIAMVPNVVGMNYWVGPGSATAGGYTFLFPTARDGNPQIYRPAGNTLANFYAQQLDGPSNAVVSLDGADLDVLPIDGSTVGLFVLAGTEDMNLSIGQRSTADFAVMDEAGAEAYEQGMPVVITNQQTGERIFGGVVYSSDEEDLDGTALRHDIQAVDYHFLADKRRIPYSASGATAGAIFKAVVDGWLAAEGVTYQRGINLLSAQQSDFEINDFTAFTFGGGGSGHLTQDLTTFTHGLASAKAVTDGSGGFQQFEVKLPSTLFSPGDVVTISMMAKSLTTPTIRFYVDSDVGAVGSVTNIVLTAGWVRYTKTVTLPNPITATQFKLRWDTGGTPQAITVWMDQLQFEKAGSASTWELGGLQQSVYDGPVVTEFTSNYDPATSVFDSLAQAADFYWQIDQNLVAWFAPPGTVRSPWDATPADMERGTVKVTRANSKYRNSQYLLGATDQTSTQVETRVGDGTTTVFLTNYPIATVPTVEVNLNGAGYVAKTVGIGPEGVVDSGKDFYWNAGKNEVVQANGATKLRGPTGTIDLLRTTYVGQFPVVVLSRDDAEVAAELTREGMGTGYVDDVVVDTTLKTRVGAFQEAGGYIQRYARLGRRLSFRTYRGGLAQGQLLNVTYPKHKLNGLDMLIESVKVTHNGIRFVYDVVALAGPINATWVQFFQMLADQSKAVVDKINLGSGNTVATLTSFTATGASSASFVATVNACLFPSSTAYPSTSTYPC